jgi:hypothetical protein
MHAPLEPAGQTHEPSWGPAMASLPTDKMRAFVVAMYDVPPGKHARINAAISAGYGTATSSRKSIGVIATRLLQDERIQVALEEHGRTRVRALGPLAVHSLEALLRDKKHKGHERAVALIVERLAPAEFHHLHEHDHRHRIVDHEAAAVQLLRKLKSLGTPRDGLIRFFGCNAIDRLEAMLAKQDAEAAGAGTIDGIATEIHDHHDQQTENSDASA